MTAPDSSNGPRPPSPEPRAPYPRSPRTTLRVPIGFPQQATLLEKIEYLVAIGGPLGFIPWLPATWASLATALAWHWLPNRPVAIIAVTVGLTMIGARTAATAEHLLQSADPRNVVIDELAGQSLTFLYVAPATFKTALLGFALFRVFDVLKPFPARHAEKLPGGWGVMVDDLISGLYAAALLGLLHRLW